MFLELHSDITQNTVAVIGLGYVGLPLALAFGEKFDTIGFDISTEKIDNYNKNIDLTGENSQEDFKKAKKLFFTCNPFLIQHADFIIVTVPTPLKPGNIPDLNYLGKASEIIGQNIKKGAVVVYESTVYPGVTEGFCVSIIERFSAMKCGVDFKVGYSPERINPGDKEHSLKKIIKVVSGQDTETLEIISKYYASVVEAGVYKAESIKVAEAAKAIENTQRDLNIALMNELSIIFNKIGIDTNSVINAAGTKWNFIPFKPGLVGGHCIGVDPYYLTYCAQLAGYHPEVILAGRKINDSMGFYVAQNTIKEMVKAKIDIENAKVLIMGLTFKENCPDIRNSRAFDILLELRDYGINSCVHDPLANPDEVYNIYDDIIFYKNMPDKEFFDTIIIAVAHKDYIQKGADFIKKLLRDAKGVVVDVKSIFNHDDFLSDSIRYWRL
jgi:UDP-N-acetyl-D-galactosamine dehydrogenase